VNAYGCGGVWYAVRTETAVPPTPLTRWSRFRVTVRVGTSCWRYPARERLEAPFLEQLLNAGKHAVIVMKQERRDIFQDAQRLKGLVAPQIFVDGPRKTRLWDIPNLCSFSTLDREGRVVWAEEQTLKHKIMGGKPTDVLEEMLNGMPSLK
jgi:hypothetical protein